MYKYSRGVIHLLVVVPVIGNQYSQYSPVFCISGIHRFANKH